MKTRVAIAASLLAGCASVDRPADWHRHMPPAPGAFAAPGPFDAMAIDGIWGVGDQVVYRIEVDDAGTQHGFTFTLTTTKLPPSEPDSMVLAHPVHGHVLTRSSNDGWQHGPVIAYHGRGDATLHAELRGDDGTSCGGDITAELFAHWWVDDMGVGLHAGIYPLFRALLGLDCLNRTLLRVIRAPSAWSVVTSLGRVSVGLDCLDVDELHYADQETPFGALPTTWLPMAITANGQPALDGRIQFTWKRPPLLLAAGVLQIEAWHPDDPARRLTARLLSARRGTPPDAPAANDLGDDMTAGMTEAQLLAVKRGATTQVLQRGPLADGRRVELVEFDVPNQLLVGVFHEDSLLFASCSDDLVHDYLRRRGFTADAPASTTGR